MIDEHIRIRQFCCRFYFLIRGISLPKRIFSRIVPVNKCVSCKTIPNERRRDSSWIFLNIDAIITDLSLLNIVKRLIKLVMVVLPAPVAPTKATFCPGSAKD